MANVSSWFIREITGIFSNEGTSKNWPIMFNSNILRGKRIKMFERAYLSVTSMHQLSKVSFHAWAKFHFLQRNLLKTCFCVELKFKKG